jgi:hypothetical protein
MKNSKAIFEKVQTIELDKSKGMVMLCYQSLISSGNFLFGFSLLGRIKIWNLENLESTNLVQPALEEQEEEKEEVEEKPKGNLVQNVKNIFKGIFGKKDDDESGEDEEGKSDSKHVEAVKKVLEDSCQGYMFSFKEIFSSENVQKENSITFDLEIHTGLEQYGTITFSFDKQNNQIFGVQFCCESLGNMSIPERMNKISEDRNLLRFEFAENRVSKLNQF